MYPTLAEHARRELGLSGHARRWPAHTAVLVAAVAAFDATDHPEGAPTAAEQLHTLLCRGNLTPLTSDQGEWADRTHPDDPAGPLWRNRRNPQAFSPDGGQTYWLLKEPADDTGARPIHISAPPRLAEGVADL